jgi:abortive infection bacteriophage resistance protein
MKYTKPSLTSEQQADLLLSRGLVADRELLIKRLRDVNYYRLSAYWYTFRKNGLDDLKEGTRFEVIWDNYVFDRQLRLLVMDAIERVEVSIKTRLTNYYTLSYGPFGYTDRANLPGISVDNHRKLMDKIHKEIYHSKENFVQHYLSKYSSETELPLWMAVEIMDFGSLLTLFRHTSHYLKRKISNDYGIAAKVLESWLLTLNYVRNLCAHHGRLWNRVLPYRPLIPYKKHRPEFHDPVIVKPDRIFSIISILNYMLLNIAPQSKWKQRFIQLIEKKHPGITIRFMGFPENWRESVLWK